ncbi:MAG TPA: acetyl-CoA synthetase [Bacteroidetes bacterium]|nr:acetyl-CoA synthetase [Bacteroidota bacterium]
MQVLKRFYLALIVVFFLSPLLQAKEARLLRQPHINGDKIAFVYAGDIYTVSIKGGEAKQITSFDGMELFPQFSPDGKWIAFSGEYSGTREIYIIPAEGGVPKQLTFYPDVGRMPPRGGWDNIPIDWSPDGKKILIRSNRTPYGRRVSRYFWVDPFHESLEQPLQIPEGGPATLSPDGSKLAYSIKSREFRTWKRYKAGRAQDIWIYDLQANKIRRITKFAGTDNFPLWVGSTIYFTSDRKTVDSIEPRTLNIFAYDIDSKKMRKVTRFTEFDCLWPSRGKGGIVFENGGFIYLLNPATDRFHKISVIIHSDKPYMRPVYKNVSKYIESFAVSPSGKRAVFTARGEIFTVPEKYGDIKNFSQTPSIREMNIDWSPDGKYISYLSEKSGDYELYLQKYHAQEPAVQITKNSGSWITGYIWSPDSKKIILGDKKNRLCLLNVATGGIKLIDRGIYSAITGYNWSPNSDWVAYTKDAENHLTAIRLYSLDRDQTFQLTADGEDNYSPVFGREGKYLYFISRRNFNFRNRNFDAKLYVGTLRTDLESPFKPRNDDEVVGEKKNGAKKKTTTKKSAKKVEPKKLKIDVDGFDQRVLALPGGTGSYRGLTAVKGGLLYLKGGTLYKYDMGKRKESKIMEKVVSYMVAAKGEKFIYRSGRNYGIAALKPNQKSGAGKLNLTKMEMKISPAIEWKQLYTDGWRIMRDWFYDPNMNGVDWQKMHDKYAVLVPYVAHRADLDYIFGELIGELNSGHCYVNPGDMQRVQRVPVGVLGCELQPDGKFYRIAKIYPGENWGGKQSPLTEPGIKVKEGEYLIGIDGRIVHTDENPYRFLENKVKRQVTLLINGTASEKGARKIVVQPVASEQALRHLAWVQRNKEIVDKLSGGRIGYIYVPNTSFEGFKEFYRGWFDQFTKDGLIIDERYNGGGSLPHPMALDMAYPALQYWARRNLALYSTPMQTHEGPKVMLINGRSSSGGDAFPAYFRTLKLGPLMGQTTWGGLIGYSGSPRLADGGGFAVPAFAYVNREGRWDVEYYGVKPDIEVFDDPTLIQAGYEPMLEEAVKYILGELKKHPPRKVKKPKGAIRK